MMKQKLKEEASSARSSATWAKWSAQIQIGHVQDLSRKLDEQARSLQQQVAAGLIHTDLSNVLDGATLRMDLYDWTDGLAACSGWGLLHSIAEGFNNFNIQSELTKIGERAVGIGNRVEDTLVKLFCSQRRSHLEDAGIQAAVTEGADRGHITEYLGAWAEPSVFEYIF